MKQFIHKIFWKRKERVLEKEKNSKNREKSYPVFEDIKNCLIIWKADSQEKEWLKAIKEKFPNAIIDKVCIISEDFKDIQVDHILYVKKSEVSFKGKIGNEGLKSVLKSRHDLLLDLSLQGDIFQDFIVGKSMALCKVSNSRENPVTDIMIENVENVLDLIDRTVLVLSKFRRLEPSHI